MALQPRFLIVLGTIVLLAGTSVWLAVDNVRLERVHGQGVISEIIGPSLNITDEIGLQSLAASLTTLDLSDAICSHIDTSSNMVFLGFAKSNGGDKYKGTSVFCRPDGELEQISWGYDPATDLCIHTVSTLQSPPHNLSPAVLLAGDPLGWIALLDVVSDPPDELLDNLTSGLPLVGAWVEGVDFTDEWRVVYLRMGDGDSSETLRIWGKITDGTAEYRYVESF